MASAGAGEVEFWATLLDDELFLAIRLSDDRMRQREYKVAHFAGSLRPSVAGAMALLSQPTDDDVVLDPLCGAGDDSDRARASGALPDAAGRRQRSRRARRRARERGAALQANRVAQLGRNRVAACAMAK